MRPRRLPRHAALIAAGLIAATASMACGSTETADIPRGDCPAAPMNIVVTVDQWGEMTETLAGDCAEVTTIIAGTSADPHEFEPTPSDLVAFENADLVVMNGVGYDAWATKAIEQLGGELPVVAAGEVAGRTPGDNPHLWYSPEVIREMGAAVTDEATTLLPDAADYLDTRSEAWATELVPYDDAVRNLADIAGGGFASTEPVADDLAEATGLRNVTPPGYRSSALNETDPSPADLADFTRTLTDGIPAVLIVNSQSQSAFGSELADQAEQAGVPVVEVTESIPPDADGFVSWQVDQLEALTRAVSP